MIQTLKSRIYQILESSNSNDLFSQIDDWFVSILVILDVTAFILETSNYVSSHFKLFVDELEVFSVICFTLLYILQLWSCVVDSRYSHPVWGRFRYAKTPLVIIDLMAILPFYLILIFPQVKVIRFTDTFRLLRLLKLIRYSEALQTIIRAIAHKKNELIMTLFAVLILLIFASSVMYFAENQEQPEAFPSIPAAMWWGVVTLTTVGYGDIYPVTPIGKLFGAGLALLGIGLFALPAGIVAAGFSEEIQRKKHLLSSQTILTQWTPEQQQAIAAHVEQSSELMKLCIETAKNKFGDTFEDESIICNLANLLYQEAQEKLNPPQNDSTV